METTVRNYQYVVVFRESGDHSRTPMVIEKISPDGICIKHISDLDFSFVSKLVNDKYISTALDIYAVDSNKTYVEWTTEFNQRDYSNAILLISLDFQPTDPDEKYIYIHHKAGSIRFSQKKQQDNSIFIDSIKIVFDADFLINKLRYG